MLFPMDAFQVLDISGDVGLKAFGKSKEEAFLNAAYGMYSLITEPEKIREKKAVLVTVEKDSPDGLLVAWLNELIFHFDAFGFIGRKIDMEHFADNKLRARIAGETFDPERHTGKLLIKAATYHKLSIQEMNGRWEIDVIFDI
jgi:SHS2 domain-containing protein